jgi:hypothetical protein
VVQEEGLALRALPAVAAHESCDLLVPRYTLVAVAIYWAADRMLLRRLREALPRDANVVAIDYCEANPLGPAIRDTPVVLTDIGLFILTAAHLKRILTAIPFWSIVDASGNGLALRIRWVEQELPDREVELDFRLDGQRDAFITKFFDQLDAWRSAPR